MNHDITHCSEKDCLKAETCVRYLAYLELKKYPGKFGNYHSFTITRKNLVGFIGKMKVAKLLKN